MFNSSNEINSNVQSNIAVLSEDDFENLLGSSEPEEIIDNSEKIEEEPEEVTVKKKEKTSTVKTKDVKKVKERETVEDNNNEEDEEEEVIEEYDLDDILEDEEDEEGDVKVKRKESDSSSDIDGSEGDQITEFFKAKGQGLIERGLWQDFEGSEEFEWSEENYGKMIELQAQWKAEDAYSERVEKLGPYGKIILQHIEDGGNPDEIIDLFKEMKEVEEIDKSTETGKVNLLRQYYIDELKWSESKFKREVDSWIDRDILDDEVEEIEERIQEKIVEKVALKREEAEREKQAKEQRNREFANSMQQTITSRKDLNEKEQKEILHSLLNYNQKLPDGRVVNQFTIDFLNMQKDPNLYVDFVRFVRNPEKFINSIEVKTENKTVKKNWNLIKGGGSLNKKSGGSTPTKKSNSGPGLKINYKDFNI